MESLYSFEQFKIQKKFLQKKHTQPNLSCVYVFCVNWGFDKLCNITIVL